MLIWLYFTILGYATHFMTNIKIDSAVLTATQFEWFKSNISNSLHFCDHKFKKDVMHPISAIYCSETRCSIEISSSNVAWRALS